jgi:hypothetical protein
MPQPRKKYMSASKGRSVLKVLMGHRRFQPEAFLGAGNTRSGHVAKPAVLSISTSIRQLRQAPLLFNLVRAVDFIQPSFLLRLMVTDPPYGIAAWLRPVT